MKQCFSNGNLLVAIGLEVAFKHNRSNNPNRCKTNKHIVYCDIWVCYDGALC
jgi:hypothetical protein